VPAPAPALRPDDDVWLRGMGAHRRPLTVTGREEDGAVESMSLRFARAARSLGQAARREGLRAPTFRSPPRRVGLTRTIQRRRDGGATVAVVLRGRPWPAVVADMVEGVVACNGLAGTGADRVRAALWAAVADTLDRAA
jgi:hypothetical protein